jgi:hypothetical protein
MRRTRCRRPGDHAHEVGHHEDVVAQVRYIKACGGAVTTQLPKVGLYILNLLMSMHLAKNMVKPSVGGTWEHYARLHYLSPLMLYDGRG